MLHKVLHVLAILSGVAAPLISASVSLSASSNSSGIKSESTNQAVALDNEEKRWLSEQGTFTLGVDPSWAPFEFVDDDGKYSGIGSGYIDLTSQRLGVDFKALPGLTWTEVIRKARLGQIDILPTIARTPKREKFLNFTKPYITFPMVIATRKDAAFVDSIAGLEGKRVGVVKGYVSQELIENDHKSVNLVLVKNLSEGLQQLSDGKLDAFVDNLVTITHQIHLLNLSDLKIAAPTQYKFELSRGVRKGLPELIPILNKALQTITARERATIVNSWTAIQVNYGIATSTVLYWAILLIVGALIIVVLVFYWIRFLQKQKRFVQRSEKRLASIIETAPDGIIVIDEKGIVQTFSPAAEDIFGYTNDEVIGKNISMLMPDMMAHEHDSYLERHLRTGESTIIGRGREVEGLRKDGEQFAMELTVGKAEVDGQVTYTGGIRDITERKNIELEQARVLESLSAVIESIDYGVLFLDKNFRSIVCNKAFQDMWGIDPDFVLGNPSMEDYIRYNRYKGFYDVGDEDFETFVEERVAAVEGGNISPTEMTRADGKTFIYQNRLLENGGCMLTYYDITERKKGEEELRDARDLAEEATKAKATFLATMSHEIRTPMGGVIGMVDILQETKLSDDQRQMVNTVKDSAHSLLTIINDILDFSKIEAGKLDLEEIPVSICDVVEGAGEALAVNARNKGITLSVYVDPDIPDAVLGDQVRLRQILFNFGSNAIKFTAEGKVIVRADRLPSSDAENIKIRFQVIDEGIGIPEDAQKNLFQAFSQVEASTTRRFGGTGLGLSICQRLTELMNGTIGVESVSGEGSTFSATISLGVAKEHSIKSDGLDLEGLNVLLVHQRNDMEVLIPRYLERWGARVTSCSDFEQAQSEALQAVARKDIYNVVCLDSDWLLNEQVAFVQSARSDPVLSATRYVIAFQSRSKSDRVDIENTVFVNAAPLRRSEFIRSIAIAAGRASPDVEYDDSEDLPSHAKAPEVGDAEANGQLILLAEDNLTNQDVIRRQLSMLGYAVEIASDGQEAYEMLQSRSYAILLTDCHMPVMDGFQLSENLRTVKGREKGSFPIIAVTASVMREEVDRCFASGMDDYLAKPLEMKKLKAMLQKWMPEPVGIDTDIKVPSESEDVDQEDVVSDADTNGPIDPSALKNVFGDDAETFREILGEFLAPSAANAEEIIAAAKNRSAPEVGAAAHKLKSSSRSVGAIDLAELCQVLEQAGNAADWDVIDEAVPRLPQIMSDVSDYIKAL